jgi:RimJ/RimL family protein N-acetyltransferase
MEALRVVRLTLGVTPSAKAILAGVRLPALDLEAINAADIRGQLVRMRPMRPDEAGIIHSWNNDPDVYTYWGSYDFRYSSLEEFLAEIAEDASYFDGSDVIRGRCFTIEPLAGPDAGTVIGMINTNKIEVEHHSTEIDVVIGHADYRERGYGTDAVREFLRFLFDTVGLHRVWLGTYEYNARARHVYEKLGFVQEGVARESDYVDGRWVNSVLYGILESEFRELNG